MWECEILLWCCSVAGGLLVGQHAGNGHAAAVQPPTRPQQIGQPRYRPSEYESRRPHCMSPLAPLCQSACQAPHFLQVTQRTVFHSRHVTKSLVFYNVTPCRMVNKLPTFWRIVTPSFFSANQWVNNPGTSLLLLLTLKMKALHFFEMSVTIRQSRQQNFPHDLTILQNRCEEPKSRKNIKFTAVLAVAPNLHFTTPCLSLPLVLPTEVFR